MSWCTQDRCGGNKLTSVLILVACVYLPRPPAASRGTLRQSWQKLNPVCGPALGCLPHLFPSSPLPPSFRAHPTVAQSQRGQWNTLLDLWLIDWVCTVSATSTPPLSLAPCYNQYQCFYITPFFVHQVPPRFVSALISLSQTVNSTSVLPNGVVSTSN